MTTIETLHLFQDLNQELIYFLADLKKEEWLLPSPVEGRTIKDLAAHLVDGSLQRISIIRDHYQHTFDPEPTTNHEFVSLLQQKNTEWIAAFRRLSPRIILEMLKKYDQEVFELYCRLKPEDPAVIAVRWAGQETSAVWFDIARDYTEKWYHQMQMRMASGRELLMSERYLVPLYQTLLMGLPHHLNQQVPNLRDHMLQIEITGEIRLRNRLMHAGQGWTFAEDTTGVFETKVSIPAAIGWLLFTNTERDKAKFSKTIEIQGNEQLARSVISLVSVTS